MKKNILAISILGLTLSTLTTASMAADWQPKGPIKLMIAFKAGGGVDTQARLIADELKSRHGWEIIPQNIAGKGGAVMAKDLADEPNDGLTIGMSVSEAFTYTPYAVKNAGYGLQDFDYLTTTASTQMAIFAKKSRGWNDFKDVIKEAKAGKKFSIGSFSPRLSDVIYLLEKNNDVQFNTVSVKGGKGSINGVVSDDIDMAWGAGPQNKGVVAGDFVNLFSAEAEPLKISKDAPLITEFGVPFSFGSKFMFVAPDGIPTEAKTAISDAIVTVINDPNSKVNGFINKAFGGVEVIKGEELQEFMKVTAENDKTMLDLINE